MDEENASQNKKNQQIPLKNSIRWFSSLRKQKDLQKQDLQTFSGSDGDLKKKRNRSIKKEDNVFQRIKSKLPLRMNQSINKLTTSKSVDSDFEQENLSCVNQTAQTSNDNNDNHKTDQKLDNKNETSCSNFNNDNLLEIPFTHHYRRHIAKKWIENNSLGPNMIMYKACTEMINYVWYWGETSRQDAQKQLTDKPNGSFLVRDSESCSETEACRFTLSFRICNCTFHYRLQYRENFWHFEERQYESVVDMIEDIMLRSTDENFVCYVKAHNVVPVYLRYPISRYVKIPTLQDLSKRAINQKFQLGAKDIEKLPIPVKLQQFLTEKSSLVF
ncbi:suppressor of cytokine signaling 6 [Condylostylus longicornis]|uniref:suppressor of cytokine signaling 6 n=1 Tax=Condylostylus longicornis TaxID=2530218 RepID=UPI00244E2A9F|nr:suppressor of cytokine signaling 6 [Condylostylus longicornis]